MKRRGFLGLIGLGAASAVVGKIALPKKQPLVFNQEYPEKWPEDDYKKITGNGKFLKTGTQGIDFTHLQIKAWDKKLREDALAKCWGE